MSFEIIHCVSFSLIPGILLNHCAPRTLYSAGIFDGISVPTYSGRTLRITTGKSKSSDTSVYLNMLHFSRIVRFELAHDFINRSSQFFFLGDFRSPISPYDIICIYIFFMRLHNPYISYCCMITLNVQCIDTIMYIVLTDDFLSCITIALSKYISIQKRAFICVLGFNVHRIFIIFSVQSLDVN